MRPHKIAPRRPRAGLTLIELLAASALASMLMIAVLGVIGSLSAHRKLLREQETHESWKTQLEEQLRWDFSNARRMRVRSNRLVLLGYGSRDFFSGEPTHRPAQVEYEVIQDESRSWFVRRETHLDDLTNLNARTELVCSGVDSLAIERLDAVRRDRPVGQGRGREEPTGQADAGILGAVPDRFRLILYGPDENETVLDQVILIR